MQAWDEEGLPYLGAPARAAARGRRGGRARARHLPRRPVAGARARRRGAPGRAARGRLARGRGRRPRPPAIPCSRTCAGPSAVYQWHVDVFDLPDGAVRLARSEQSENQAFRYGERAWGLQFHPEVDAAALRGLDQELRGRAGARWDSTRCARGGRGGRLAASSPSRCSARSARSASLPRAERRSAARVALAPVGVAGARSAGGGCRRRSAAQARAVRRRATSAITSPVMSSSFP